MNWLREPARKVGTWIAAAIAGIGVVTVAATQLTDYVPEKYRTKVSGAVAFLAVVSVVLTKIQAELIRAKVYSPETFAAHVEAIAGVNVKPIDVHELVPVAGEYDETPPA